MPAETAPPANGHLLGAPDGRERLSTPALLVDLDALEHNLGLVAEHCRTAGLALRPHVKGHKCLPLGRLQVESGACGLACTTLAEAELMAASGAPSLLLTSPVVDPAKTARLAALLKQPPEIITVADHPAGLPLLADAVRRAQRRLAVLIDLDVGQRRTGIPADSLDRILELAAAIAATDGLELTGLQAYYGHLQGLEDYAERKAGAAEQQRRLKGAIAALRGVGHDLPIVSGGGTGTLLADSTDSPFTELQPGSYPFLDLQYGREALVPDGRPWLVQSLFVQGRVVSGNQPDRVTIDAGMKAVSTDGGPPRLVRPKGIVADYAFGGDEHGFLTLREGSERPPLGACVELIPAHCDTTVNLHRWLHAVRVETLEAIWPIAASGHW